jgi:hypothetical protein
LIESDNKVLNLVGWIIVIVFQILLGLAGFVISGLSRNTWLINFCLTWLGITAGLSVGGLPIFLRPLIQPKRYFARLGYTGLGVFLPVMVLIGIRSLPGITETAMNNLWGPALSFCAFGLGLLGFYFPELGQRQVY